MTRVNILPQQFDRSSAMCVIQFNTGTNSVPNFWIFLKKNRRSLFIKNRASVIGDRTVFRRSVVTKVRCSKGPLFRRFIAPKVRYSEIKVHCSENKAQFSEK